MQLYLSRKRLFGLFSFAVGKVLLTGRSEEDLVRQSQAGDRTAFERLMRIYDPHIRRFVTRKVGTADRDDVVQDTWIAAWVAIKKFDPDSNFRLWIYAICFHKIQDHWRRRRTRGASAELEAEDPATLYLPAEFGRIELRECLDSFLKSCTAEQVEMLKMYYAYGFTLKEIADVYKRNLNTVKYQFYRLHELAGEHLPADPATLLSKAVVA